MVSNLPTTAELPPEGEATEADDLWPPYDGARTDAAAAYRLIAWLDQKGSAIAYLFRSNQGWSDPALCATHVPNNQGQFRAGDRRSRRSGAHEGDAHQAGAASVTRIVLILIGALSDVAAALISMAGAVAWQVAQSIVRWLRIANLLYVGAGRRVRATTIAWRAIGIVQRLRRITARPALPRLVA